MSYDYEPRIPNLFRGVHLRKHPAFCAVAIHFQGVFDRFQIPIAFFGVQEPVHCSLLPTQESERRSSCANRSADAYCAQDCQVLHLEATGFSLAPIVPFEFHLQTWHYAVGVVRQALLQIFLVRIDSAHFAGQFLLLHQQIQLAFALRAESAHSSRLLNDSKNHYAL